MKDNLKKNIKELLVIILLAFFPLGFLIIFNFISSFFDGNITKSADGFTIEKYNVILDVKENNVVDVTENITVNFTSNLKHGIFKFTPLWLKYTDKNGRTMKRKSNIYNYRAIGDDYTIDTVKKKERIKIGSPYEYVALGNKDYVIKYTYDMGQDPYSGFDEFIFHAYGDYWGTKINNATLQVNMPKSIEGYKVNFFTDKYRKESANDVVDYTIRGNSLYATFNEKRNYPRQLKKTCEKLNKQGCESDWFGAYENSNIKEPLNSALTVDIELPEGYFVGGSWNYGSLSLLITIIIFLLTLITIYKWIRFGRDNKKIAQTVEFYPPDNLSSAEIGYVFNKMQSNKKLTISLIIQLASKGYIKIDELDKNKIQITNLLKKPSEIPALEKILPVRKIVVKKLKDLDDSLSMSETTMMVHLFKQGDTKVLETNINKFLEVKDKLVSGGYIEIIDDNIDNITDEIEKIKKGHQQMLEKNRTDVENYCQLIKKLPPVTNVEKIVYEKLFNIKYDTMIEEALKISQENQQMLEKNRADVENYVQLVKSFPRMNDTEKKEYDNLYNSKDTIILSEHSTFYQVFEEVKNELKKSFKDRVHDSKASKQIKWSIIRNVLITVLSVISYSVIEDLDPRLGILYKLSFACIFINLFFTIFMSKKTEYGEIITARVKGFRHFLDTVEKAKLEELVMQNPQYFYNILPYTYVLNISKKWVQKFENIPVPQVDIGSFDYNNISSYSLLYNNISFPVNTGSGGSSSGCSSCGGGCSSCGGGCSSCGGGGSW